MELTFGDIIEQNLLENAHVPASNQFKSIHANCSMVGFWAGTAIILSGIITEGDIKVINELLSTPIKEASPYIKRLVLSVEDIVHGRLSIIKALTEKYSEKEAKAFDIGMQLALIANPKSLTPKEESLSELKQMIVDYGLNKSLLKDLQIAVKSGNKDEIMIIAGAILTPLCNEIDKLGPVESKSGSSIPFKLLKMPYNKLNDLTYSLMFNVCNPRGIETTHVHELFTAQCPNCNSTLNTYALMQIGDRLEMKLSNIPTACDACGHQELVVQINTLSDKEKNELLKDKHFQKLKKFFISSNSLVQPGEVVCKNCGKAILKRVADMNQGYCISCSKPSDKSGDCFIATACYGSYEHPDVMLFRLFRDRYLMNTILGRIFIKIYYHYSPELAKRISRTLFLKNGIKNIFLHPFALLLKRKYS